MVKKVLFAMCCSAAVLAACSHSSAPVTNEHSARIEIANETDENINAIEMDVTQMNQYVSTQGGSYADGSSIKKGDTLDFELTEEGVDFTKPVDIEVRVQMDGETTKIGTLQAVQLAEGETVEAEIVDSEGGTVNVQLVKE